MVGKRVVALGVAACLCCWAATADAGTFQKHGNSAGGNANAPVTTPALSGGGVQAGGVVWSEDFESYPLDQNIHGQGGWKGWDNGSGAGANVVDEQNHTDGGSQSIDISGGADLIHEYAAEFGATEDSGQWVYRAWAYIPGTMTGDNFFIMQNTYNDGGPYNWSVQLSQDVSRGTVESQFHDLFLPLILDEWFQIEVQIDLDTDITEEGSQTLFYGGTMFYSDFSWCNGLDNNNCGAVEIGSVDLFANSATSAYYDDIELENLPRIIGACCNDAEETCTEDSHLGDCPVGRFVRGGTCDAFDPPCGEYNDECVSAIEMGADDEVTETSLGATFTFNDFPMCFNGGDQANRTLWFKFTATHAWTRVRTCPSPVEGGAEDTILSVYPSGPNGECLEFEPEIDCSNDVCGQPAGLHAEVCVPTVPGEEYHIMVGGIPGTAPGLFTVQTSSHDECPPPTQGACCGTNQQDGSEFCFDQSSGDCFGLAGYYSGDDTRCADDECPPCNPDCPEGTTDEGGNCGQDAGLDNNSGCNGAGNEEDFTAVELDEVVCGLGSSDGSTRDTDWMSIFLQADTAYQFRVNHDFPALVGFSGYLEGFEGSGDCADGSGFINPGGNMDPGESIVEFTPTVTGLYFPYVAVSAGGAGFNYVPCCSGSNSYTAVVELATGGCVRDPAWQCYGDVEGDGNVNPVDLGLVLANFCDLEGENACTAQQLCQYDMDCDNQVNPVDAGLVSAQFGLCNPVPPVCP